MVTPGPRPDARPWQGIAAAAGLLAPDGSARPSVFAEVSALASHTGALNLGQGFPDDDGPSALRELAVAAIRQGANQYPPLRGVAPLREAVAAHQRRCYGLAVDPGTEVLVTTGATEAIAAAVLALAGPGDEVVTLEPYYDSYAGVIAMAGARHVPVPLARTASGFRLDADALRTAVGPATAVILLNTPHNPTGTVLDAAELAVVAEVAQRHDAVVVTDEVYEHLVFDGARHVPLAVLACMAERTVTISSSGKSWSLTGWKIGWATGPADLVTAIATVKQFLSFASGAPFQPAIAVALGDDAFPRALAADLALRRDLLAGGLARAGWDVVVPQGTYFVVADAAPLGHQDAAALCHVLPHEAGVAAVPVSAFCSPGREEWRSLVRFTFVKSEATLREAVARLTGWSANQG